MAVRGSVSERGPHPNPLPKGEGIIVGVAVQLPPQQRIPLGGKGTGPCFRPTVCPQNAVSRRKMDQSPTRACIGCRGRRFCGLSEFLLPDSRGLRSGRRPRVVHRQSARRCPRRPRRRDGGDAQDRAAAATTSSLRPSRPLCRSCPAERGSRGKGRSRGSTAGTGETRRRARRRTR